MRQSASTRTFTNVKSRMTAIPRWCVSPAVPELCLGIALFLLLCTTATAQLTVLPSPGKCLGYASAPEPGKWIVFAAGMMPVQPTLNDGGKSIVWEGDAGDYAVIYLPPGDGQPVVQKVTLGGGPAPGPDPTPPPGPGGKWQLLIVHQSAESLDNLPQGQRDLITSLVIRQELVSMGHAILGIRDDNVFSGAVSDHLKPFVAKAKDQPLPVLVMAPRDGGDVVAHPLPADWDGLQKLLKGGK